MRNNELLKLLCAFLSLAAPAQASSLRDSFLEANSDETHGRIRDAIVRYQRIIASAKPDDPIAMRCRIRIGRLTLEQNQIAQAEPAYQLAIKSAPALFAKDSELMVDMDDFSESYTAMAKRGIEPTTFLFHALELRRAVDPHHPNLNQSYRLIALNYLSKGLRKDAELSLKRCIEIERNFAPSRMNLLVQDEALLASIYMGNGEWQKAEQITRGLLAQSEKYPNLAWSWSQLHCTLGKCQAEQFQFDASDKEYQLALELAKKYPNPNGDISPECIKGLKENLILKKKNKGKLPKAKVGIKK